MNIIKQYEQDAWTRDIDYYTQAQNSYNKFMNREVIRDSLIPLINIHVRTMNRIAEKYPNAKLKSYETIGL